MAKFDPSNPEYRSAPTLPPGEHIVIVASVEKTTSKSSGVDMLKHKLRCIDPDSKHNGSEIFTNTMLSGGGAFRTAALANVIAQTKANKAVLAPAFDPDVLEDLQRVFWAAPFVVVCGEREYQGQKQTDVQDFKVVQPIDRKRLAAKYGPTMMPGAPVPPSDNEDDTFVPSNYEGGNDDDVI